MPIRLTVFGPDRLVVGVAVDTITLADLVDFMRQMTEGELHRFRKIIDLSAARPEISSEELAQFSEGLRAALKDTTRGAMAIVVGDETSELAERFTSATGDGRPADVFRSIHAARQWLNTKAFPR